MLSCFGREQKNYHFKSRVHHLIPTQSFNSRKRKLVIFVHDFWKSVCSNSDEISTLANRKVLLAILQQFVNIMDNYFVNVQRNVRRVIWIGHYKNVKNKQKCLIAKLPKDVIPLILDFIPYDIDTIEKNWERDCLNQLRNIQTPTQTAHNNWLQLSPFMTQMAPINNMAPSNIKF